MSAGSQGFMPKVSCAARNTSGAPRIAEVPGGVGMTLGKAKTSINAPMARSPSVSSRWRIEMRSLDVSSAILRKIREVLTLRFFGAVSFKIPAA